METGPRSGRCTVLLKSHSGCLHSSYLFIFLFFGIIKIFFSKVVLKYFPQMGLPMGDMTERQGGGGGTSEQHGNKRSESWCGS